MNANFFKKLLYIPNSLSLQAAGIEICSKSIKYIEFFNKKGEFSIKNFGEIPLQQNIVKDGEILNKAVLVQALNEVKNKISSDFVKVSIPEEKTYIFDVVVPKEAQGNIREALEFKIEENVPLKLAEASFEYEIVEDNIVSRDMTLNVSVIPKRIISDYADVFEQAGIYPVSYEIESKMIVGAVTSNKDKKNSIVINIKDNTTVFVAIIDGLARLSSSISVGESAIRESLMKTGQFSDETDLDKFFEGDFSFETTYTKDLYLSLVNIFSVLKDEVEKFNAYISNKFPNTKDISQKNIERIILCGRSSVIPSLAKQINQTINAEVVIANVWSNFFDIKENIAEIKFNDSLNFVTPIGLVASSYKE